MLELGINMASGVSIRVAGRPPSFAEEACLVGDDDGDVALWWTAKASSASRF